MLLCAALLLGTLSGCRREELPYVPTGDALHNDNTVATAPTVPENQAVCLCYNPKANWNPFTCTDFTNRAMMPLLYQCLFSVSRSYEVIPVLCAGYRLSADMRTHTFYLASARFSDGTVITPEDVAASLLAAKSGSYYAGRFQHISSISAGEDAVIIKTDTPMENLAVILDIPIVKADQVQEPIPMGTGPFRIDDSTDALKLRRQTGWWCSAALPIYAAEIPLVPASTPAQVRDQFEFADVTLVCTDPGSDTYADYRCDYELWDCECGIFLYLGVNSGSAVFKSAELRQALACSIDRDMLVSTFYRGFALSTCLPASPLSPNYHSAIASRFAYKEGKLAAYLEENNLTGHALTLLLNSDDSLRLRTGRAISKMLVAAGFKVTVVECNSKDYKAKLKAGEFDLYLGQTKLSPNMDLSAFYATRGALNFGGIANTGIYAMNLEALANSGNYYNLYDLFTTDAHIVPILFRSYAVYATRGMLTDFTPARDNLFFYTLGKTLNDILIK